MTHVTSVKDFGATSDGVTDDAAAIQAALESAASESGSGVCLFPAGRYRIRSGIALSGSAANLKIQGVGPGRSTIVGSGVLRAFDLAGAQQSTTSLAAAAPEGATTLTVGALGGARFAPGTLAYVSRGGVPAELVEIRDVARNVLTLETPLRWAYDTGDAVSVVAGPTWVSIEDLTVEGANQAVHLRLGAHLRVRNLDVRSFSNQRAIHLEDCVDVEVAGCRGGHGAESVIQLTRTGYFSIRNNVLHRNGYPGIVIASHTSHGSVVGNDCTLCATYGIFLNDFVRHVTVAQNRCAHTVRDRNHSQRPPRGLDSNAYGIALQSDVSHCAVSGNTIRGGNTGIYLAIRANHNVVTGNTIAGTRKGDATIAVAGVYLDTECDHNSVTANVVEDADERGIFIQTGSNRNAISANTILGVNAVGEVASGITFTDAVIGTCTGNVVERGGPEVRGSLGIQMDNSEQVVAYGNHVRQFERGLQMAGTTARCSIVGNYFRENTENAVTVVNEAEHRIEHNVGHNPVGMRIIPVGPSPFAHTAGSSGETVFIRGGTVTNINIDDTTLFGSSPATVELPPNKRVVVTYSARPTMTAMAH